MDVMRILIALFIIWFVFSVFPFVFGFVKGLWDAVNGKPYDDSLFNDEGDTENKWEK